MTRANGSFDFLRRECVVGTAFNVDRTYLEGQFEVSDPVTLDYKQVSQDTLCLRTCALTFSGKIIGGGGRSSSATLNG